MTRFAVTRRGFGRAAATGVALVAAPLIVMPLRGILAQSAPASTGGTVSLADLNRMSAADFAAAVGGTFQLAPWVAEAAATKRPFASVTALHEAMFDVMRLAPADKQLAFLRAQPELSSAAARAGTIPTYSKGEQASLGLTTLSEPEFERFQKLNAAYKAKFGFPFIIAVRRYTRDSILGEFERRLENQPAAELAAALQQEYFITRLRIAGLVTGNDVPKVIGLLDTHVLDAVTGGPAVGMKIELFEFSGDQAHKIAETMTNSDGRNGTPLIAGRPLPIGRYELRFGLGNYFVKRATGLNNPPFLDIVPIRFSVAEPETHYHVPLLCTPWSYSTYKGS
jgi:2-oxo-4-hydroxy-4-carboxy-5-ureidoimidazoline decarboxylase